jgi:hypothetical protein
MTRMAIAVACAAALAACATPTPPRRAAQDARAVLEARAPVAIERMAWDPLPAGESRSFRLDDTAAVILVDGRRSYARGYALPEVTGRARVSIESLGFGAGGGVFYPEVVLLDERFRPVARIERDRFALRGSGGFTFLSADAFFDLASSRARYVLVTERSIAEAEEHVVQPTSTGAVPLVVPIGAMMFVWMIPTGSTAGPTPVVASPVGSLSLLVEAPRLRTIESPQAAPTPLR